MIDQFTAQCRNLQELNVKDDNLYKDESRANLCDLVAKILDSEHHNKMKSLTINSFEDYGLKEKGELTDEDKKLVNSLAISGLTQLTDICLKENENWWLDSEAQECLTSFIQ